MITLRVASQKTGFNYHTLYDFIQSGRLAGYQPGGKGSSIYVYENELEAFIKAGHVGRRNRAEGDAVAAQARKHAEAAKG